MRIIISHLSFAYYAGTETYMLTVAQQLERLGHDVTIYADDLGAMADFARRQGVRVVGELSELPDGCDAVYAQDASTAHQLAERFPEAVRLFGLHSAHNPLHCPPQLDGVCQAVIAFNDRLARRAEHLAHRAEVVRLRQPIDLKRFSLPSPSLSARERPRVLALSNHLSGPRARMIEAACREAGAELITAGAHVQGATPRPEHAIAGVEIVVSLGRGALEAMAGGRSVYILGPNGADGWVTPETYPAMESDGFSGRAFDLSIDLARLTADLAAWQDGIGEANRDLVWAHHDGERHAIELVELIQRLGGTTGEPTGLAEELARLVRIEWYSFVRAEGAVLEARQLRTAVEAQREQAHAATRAQQLADHASRVARERVDQLEAESRELAETLENLRGTRRYRLACLLATPLDRLRGLRRH